MKCESQIYIQKLEERIKLRFLDKTIISHALGPTSKEKKRLELLGDAVLNTAIIDYIQKSIPDISNGECTHVKESYVNNERLIQVGIELDMHKFSEWEGRKALANTLEALVGVIYRDQGYEVVNLFILKCFPPPEKELQEIRYQQKIKQKYSIPEIILQEKVEMKYNKIPKQEIILREKVKERYNVMPYMIVKQGEEDKITIHIYARGECIAIGDGKSEKQARINAVHTALKKLESRNIK